MDLGTTPRLIALADVPELAMEILNVFHLLPESMVFSMEKENGVMVPSSQTTARITQFTVLTSHVSPSMLSMPLGHSSQMS